MVTRLTATDAARSFSSLLSRVADGETLEIERHGQVVARVTPPSPRRRSMTATEFAEVLERLPKADPGFADDIEGLERILLPPRDHWAS